MKGVKLLYGASVLMVLGFCVHILVDYLAYRKSFTSAPFWVWIAIDAVLWLLPALLAFLAGLIVSRKKRNKEKIK